MRPKIFFLLAFAAMFLNVSCPDEDLYIDVLQISVDPSIQIAVGDTVRFQTEFGANLNGGNRIGENGGLVVLYVFQLDSTNNLLTEAVSVSDLVITEGEPFSSIDILDEAGHYFQYRCPNGICQFSVGWQPQAPGMYIIRPEGLGFEGLPLDRENSSEQNFFEDTQVINLPDYSINYPWLFDRSFNYQPNSGFPRTYSFFQGGLLYFEVE